MFRHFVSLFTKEKPVQSSGILLGLDAAGKTTILYQLRSGREVTTTIPTIGFNVESINTPSWRIDSWDVGGCDKTRPAWGRYLGKAQFMIFVHDCDDRDRLAESIEELQAMLHELVAHEGRHVFILLNKQDLLDEKGRSKEVEDLQHHFEKAVQRWKSELYIEVVDSPGLNCRTGHQLGQTMAHIKEVLIGCDAKTVTEISLSSHTDTATSLPLPPSKAQLVERIKQADATAESPEKFWGDFMTANLPTWDHLTHLRAGYFVMVDKLPATKSILECADVFVKHLERLRSARPDRFRNTDHRTMTVFWLIQLRNAAIDYSANIDGSKTLPAKEKFSAMLHHSPHLASSSLWRDYYTKEVMFSPEAKVGWRVPDIRSLSSNLDISEEETFREKS